MHKQTHYTIKPQYRQRDFLMNQESHFEFGIVTRSLCYHIQYSTANRFGGLDIASHDIDPPRYCRDVIHSSWYMEPPNKRISHPTLCLGYLLRK